MKKVVLTYGLIGGVMIMCFVWLISSLCQRGMISYDRTELYGYSSMIVALTMVFFGIKSYRDNNGRGIITFWKGVQIGLLITLIGTFMYFLAWTAYGRLHPEFLKIVMDKYEESETRKMKTDGKSQKDIDEKIENMHKLIEMFKNPFFGFLEATIEMGPVGIIITFISAGLLRKKEMLPA
jgi:hypothetical protein